MTGIRMRMLALRCLREVQIHTLLAHHRPSRHLYVPLLLSMLYQAFTEQIPP